ncbi:MAG: 16S rRNA (guanine(527)-N(7))-methyltransferase RsmG [Desulfobulbaceae bacterium]|nr:16S rRNA (guanine(527)-N(7))-methyltransferase RsmG [Desulfobulbaceae bacterium]
MLKNNSSLADIEILLRKGLDALSIPIANEYLSQLSVYVSELHKWNRRMNLIAKNTTVAESVEKHFLDSLTLLPVIRQYKNESMTLLDVGTGAGFPGLVLKAACPELEVTLVEPREKRSIFLKHIIRTLGLSKVQVISSRIEDDAIAIPQGGYSFITSRAVAEPNIFLPMISRFTTEKTIIITMLGGREEPAPLVDELAEKFQVLNNHHFALPASGDKRVLCLLKAR